MNKRIILSFFSFVLLFYGCSPKISTRINKTYSPLNYKEDVLVLGLNDKIPDNAQQLGEVKISHTGFTTNCSYDVVLDKAKLEARKVGGNVIKITEHKPPANMGSNCHRIKALILKVEDVSGNEPENNEIKLRS